MYDFDIGLLGLCVSVSAGSGIVKTSLATVLMTEFQSCGCEGKKPTSRGEKL